MADLATPTVTAFRDALREVLESDRSRLCAAATDDSALAELVERVAYRLQVEAGLQLDPAGARAQRAATGLPVARDVLLDIEPHHARHVASSLQALLLREPWKSGGGWEAERLVLGALFADLGAFAAEAGEPEAEPRDLRGHDAKAAERTTRELQELAEIRLERERYAELAREIDELPAATAPATAPAVDGASLAWI